MEREFKSLRAKPEAPSAKSPERVSFPTDKLIIGLAAAIAIGVAWQIRRSDLKLLSRVESLKPRLPTSARKPKMTIDELVRRAEEIDEEEKKRVRQHDSRRRRRKTTAVQSAVLSTLTAGALLTLAADSWAGSASDKPAISRVFVKSGETTDAVGVPLVKTPSLLNIPTPALTLTEEPTIAQAPEPTFKPTLQPIATSVRIETPIEIAEVGEGSGLQAQIELADCPSGWPVESGEISQGPLGWTSHSKLYPAEQAIDIVAAYGSEAFATFDGRVISVNFDISSGYGIYVDIEGVCDGYPFTARWAHLSGVADDVIPGAIVGDRQVIGFVGKTGRSYGSHLHYAFFNLPMVEPYVPITLVSYECDNEAECNARW